MGIFLVYVLNSFGINLSRRIFCIFYGSSHWSFSGALSPARARLTSGLSSSSVCADGHMFNGPPEDQLQHQAADRAGGVLHQQVPEAGQAGGGVTEARQLSEMQVKVWFLSRRTKRDTHTLLDTCPSGTSLRWFLWGFAPMLVPPAGCWSDKRRQLSRSDRVKSIRHAGWRNWFE